MKSLKKILSIKDEMGDNGVLYKKITLFGIKFRFIQKKENIKYLAKEVKLLRTIIEKTIDIKSIPKATGNLRKVQLIKSKIVEIFDTILKDNNTQYWIDFGTLIGAIRHKGFIPWDDDIDICMMKEEYLKLPALLDTEKLRQKGLKFSYGNEKGYQIVRFGYKTFDIDVFPMEYINKKCETEKEKNDFTSKWLKIRKTMMKKFSIKDFKSGKINHFTIIPEVEKIKRSVIDKNYKENPETNQFIRSVETMTTHDLCAVYDDKYVFPLQNIEFEDMILPAPIDPLWHLYQVNEYGEYGDVMNFPTFKDTGFTHTQKKYDSNIDYDKILSELALIAEDIKK